jgi:hypothetical protein
MWSNESRTLGRFLVSPTRAPQTRRIAHQALTVKPRASSMRCEPAADVTPGAREQNPLLAIHAIVAYPALAWIGCYLGAS